MAIEFNTTEYQFAHGKMPRGEGRWAFFFKRGDRPIFFHGTFTEAKTQARAYAHENGFSFVTVGS